MSRALRTPDRLARVSAARLLIVALLGATGCAYSLVSGGQLRPGPFEQIVDRTVRARGIVPAGEVRTRVIPSAELSGLLRSALAAEWTGVQIQSYQEGLTTLGLWPAERDLADEFVAVYAEEVVGLYLPTERTLYLVDDAPVSWSLRLLSALTRRDLPGELILAHELVHFLQHQAFADLMDPDPFWNTQADAASAVQAALEGDALRYGIASLEIEPPAADELRAAIEEDSATRSHGALAEAPALLRLTVDFPYAYGYGLSLREGRALLAEPPASTEQVLHPEKRDEPFQAIDLAGLRAALPASCEVAFEDTLGELGISVLLRDLDPEVSATAWEGWDGDRWLAARCAGQRDLMWLTAWDSETDAAEFAAAYARIAPGVAERAGMASSPVAQVSGRDVAISTSALTRDATLLDELARRVRIVDLPALRAHFGPESAEASEPAQPGLSRVAKPIAPRAERRTEAPPPTPRGTLPELPGPR